MKTLMTKHTIIPFIIIIFSIFGLLVSFQLSIDKVRVLEAEIDKNEIQLMCAENPEIDCEAELAKADIQLGCAINATLDCKSVMNTWQAQVFGFPNMFIGIAGYAMMLVFGITLLLFDPKNRFYLLSAHIGALFAFIFSYWLIYESVYTIQHICIYCVYSWFSSNVIFFSLTYWNIKNKTIPVIKSIEEKSVSNTFRTWYIAGIVILFTICLALVYLEFGDALFA